MNRPPRPRRRRTAGFTMIEVMIAMLLTAIATSGIIALYVVQTRSSGYSRHTTEATILAQGELERLRTSSILTVIPDITTGLNEYGVVVPGGLFEREYSVTAGPLNTGTGLIDYDDVVVVVRWDEDGNSRSVILRSRRNR